MIDYLTPSSEVNFPEADQCREARRVIKWLEERDCSIKFSEISVGEFVKVVFEKGLNENMLADFFVSVKGGEFAICRVEASELIQFVDLIPKIRSRENRAEVTDALIIAQSMSDGTSHGLLTFDAKLSNSAGLTEVISENLGGRKFRITEDPTRG